MQDLKNRIVITDELIDHLAHFYNNVLTEEYRERIEFHHFMNGWIKSVDNMLHHTREERVKVSWKLFS